MTDVAPARGKRARSPSPVYGGDSLASPLDVLLKRRRRTERANAAGFAVPCSGGGNGYVSFAAHPGNNSNNHRMFAPPPPPPIWQTTDTSLGEASHNAYDDNSSQAAVSSPLRRHGDCDDDDSAEGSTWVARRAIERRRTSQWERLQDPSARSASAPNTSQPPSLYSHASYSHQHLPTQLQSRHDSRSPNFSPAGERYRRAHPHATPERPSNNISHMSSSPVRHNPPSSTPFRDDEWTEDERLREWGDEYAAQNSVLYALHRARVEAINGPQPAAHDSLLSTPAQQRIASPPMQTTPYNLPSAYRHHQRTPLDTPGLVSSDYASSPVVGPFSPLDAPAGPAPSPVHNALRQAHEAETVRTGYEEANRLLAALNVARRRRHGPEDDQSSPVRGRTDREQHESMDERW